MGGRRTSFLAPHRVSDDDAPSRVGGERETHTLCIGGRAHGRSEGGIHPLEELGSYGAVEQALLLISGVERALVRVGKHEQGERPLRQLTKRGDPDRANGPRLGHWLRREELALELQAKGRERVRAIVGGVTRGLLERIQRRPQPRRAVRVASEGGELGARDRVPRRIVGQSSSETRTWLRAQPKRSK